jgi:4-amino-4-deoxy-L-arabinose transferase-like glycosyltransferase
MNSSTNHVNPLHVLMIAALCSMIFIPLGGQTPLFDWDEINFATSAKEMLLSGQYSRITVGYEPFWEKPPLFIWMQALSMKLFGINEYAARFPNAIAGILTICTLFVLGTRYFRGRVGWFWALSYLGAIFPAFYFNTGLIDPFFNYFIFMGIFQMFLTTLHPNTFVNAIWAGICIGLAVLTKGPVAILVSGIVILAYALSYFPYRTFRFKHLFLFICCTTLISSLWFIPEMIRNGMWFLREFLQYQIQLASENVAGHQQPFYYHFFVLLIGCFPSSIIALSIINRKPGTEMRDKAIKKLMGILFLTVLLLFSIVKTKIVHYSSLCWIPLTFFSGFALNALQLQHIRFRPYQTVLFVLLGLLWSVALLLLPLLGQYPPLKEWLIASIQDPFAVENLKVSVPWHFRDLIPPLLFLFVFVFATIRLFQRKTFQSMNITLWSLLLIMPVYTFWVVPKAEQHIQGKLITFYKSLAHQQVYIKTAEKSYAPYFYAHHAMPDSTFLWQSVKQQWLDSMCQVEQVCIENGHANATQRKALQDFELQWLLHGPIDKDAYVVCKKHKAAPFLELQQLQLVFDEGGYQVFKRTSAMAWDAVEE